MCYLLLASGAVCNLVVEGGSVICCSAEPFSASATSLPPPLVFVIKLEQLCVLFLVVNTLIH